MNQDFTVQKKSNICLKKNLCRRFHLENHSCTSKEQKKKKKVVQAENSPPPPPPPITFLMVRP